MNSILRRTIVTVLALTVVLAVPASASFGLDFLGAKDASAASGIISGGIKSLQQKLILLGHLEDGFEPGTYCTKTAEAVKHFQMSNGLPDTGVADEVTVEFINAAVMCWELYIGSPEPSPMTGVSRVVVPIADLRIGPGSGYNKFASAGQDSKLMVTGSFQDNDGSTWIQVEHLTYKLWILSDHVKLEGESVPVPNYAALPPVSTEFTPSGASGYSSASISPFQQSESASAPVLDFDAHEEEITAPDAISAQFNATGQTPYFPADVPKHINYTITVTAATATAYSGAGSSGTVAVGTVYKNERYSVLAWGSDTGDVTWWQIQLSSGVLAWVSRACCDLSAVYTPIPDRVFTPSRIPVIYLSPETRASNPYSSTIMVTNEADQMERVAGALKAYLEQRYDCIVYLPPRSLSISFLNRPLDAYRKGADIYLAIHSNAGGSAYGCETYTFAACPQSVYLGTNIVAEMQRIKQGSGVPASTISAPVKNGMEYFKYGGSTAGIGYGEVRDPSHLGMVGILAEVEFHDKAVSANWIVNNTDKIADGLANALNATFNFPAKSGQTTPTPNPTASDLLVEGKYSEMY